MTTITRWKLATAILAVLAGFGFLRGRGGPSNTPAAQVAARSATLPQQFRRPLRISPEAAGISQADLVERLLAASTLKDIATLAEKLGAVGDDEAIDAVLPLVKDTRRGVPEVILAAFGQIGTEHAVDILVGHARDDRPMVRYAAISALGVTQSERAEELLLELARRAGDPAQSHAISALGALATDNAIRVLTQLASNGDYQVGNAAVYALGSIGTLEADAALYKLFDAPDSRIAASALGVISHVDAQLLDRLTRIVKSGDPQLAHAALAALSKAGEAALPALREAALRGAINTRYAAVAAIGEIGGDESIQLLGEILRTGDRQSAMTAAGALASAGGAEARALLIEVALSDRGQMSGALAQLSELDGDDVDHALLAVLRDRSGSSSDRRAALPRLLKTGKPEALQLAIDLATKGSRSERYEAMRMLADAGIPKAFDALIDIAGKSRGNTRMSALEMLAQVRPGDAAVGQLLSDALFSGRREESHYAANVLGRIGSEEARQALVTALSDKDKELAAAAASALGQAALTDTIKTAMINASRDNSQVRLQVVNHLLQAGAPEGMQMAEDLLRSKDPEAASAVWALANLGTPEARRLLDTALGSSEPSVKMAAISSLGQSSDEQNTDTLLRLTRDGDPDTRTAALQTLGQVGSERAQLAIIEATRSGRPEERIAAISGLASMDDTRASQQLAVLMRDPDKNVAQLAISSSYNAGPEVDVALTNIVNDAAAAADLRIAAASQLRGRGADLDDATEKRVTELAGAAYGGEGYGGHTID